MKTTPPGLSDAKDQTLHWMMRIGGALLVLSSVFFLVRNLGFGVGDDVFFTMSLGLGSFSFAASWLPDRERPSDDGDPRTPEKSQSK